MAVMTKDFDSWNRKKKEINELNFNDFVHEREIWWCSLGLNVGSEENGKNKSFERPVLILRKFNKDIVLVVPLTTKIKDNDYYFRFQHNNIWFSIILSQLRVISTKRLNRRIRKVDNHLFKNVKEKIISISIVP